MGKGFVSFRRAVSAGKVPKNCATVGPPSHLGFAQPWKIEEWSLMEVSAIWVGCESSSMVPRILRNASMHRTAAQTPMVLVDSPLMRCHLHEINSPVADLLHF